MSALLRKLWDATFHLEGKFLRTCWQLFMPGKVTLEFFKGKQDRYPHPLRMFAIVMFLFLFMANLVLNRKEQNHSTGGVVSIDKVAVTPEGDTIEITNDISRYDAWKYEAELYDFWRDYEQLPESWRTSSTQKSVDSLLKNYNKRHHLEKPGLPDTLDNYTDTT
ncbi:MAG: DUF3667 domain-containing protein, partial [Saprospiraceae bacterium]|nr:DUF3667 domain-containing protein [Saprospiraceae bacterium]